MDIALANRAVAPLDLGAVSAMVALSGGSADVFRLDLDSGMSVVLKIYQDDETKIVGGDGFAATQAQTIGLPVTRYLVVDHAMADLPFRYVVTNYLPGVPAGTLQDHPDRASLYRQMGGLLQSLHTIAMPGYGRIGPRGVEAPLSTNTAFVRGRLDGALSQFAAHGAAPDLAARLRDIAEAAFDAVVPHSKGAVLAHDDLHPNNVLAVEIDGKLTLSGLIDFGNAHAADPVCDLAKCLFCSAHDAPGSTQHILEGYGPIDHPAPKAALAFYTLLHRIIMWWWLRHVGVLPTADAPSEIMDDLRRTAAGS